MESFRQTPGTKDLRENCWLFGPTVKFQINDGRVYRRVVTAISLVPRTSLGMSRPLVRVPPASDLRGF